jgi:hypothetical protein
MAVMQQILGDVCRHYIRGICATGVAVWGERVHTDSISEIDLFVRQPERRSQEARVVVNY